MTGGEAGRRPPKRDREAETEEEEEREARAPQRKSAEEHLGPTPKAEKTEAAKPKQPK